MADKVYFLNTCFDRMPKEEAIDLLLARLLSRQGGRVYYANAHTMVTAAKERSLAESLGQCDLLLADGSGVLWSSALLKSPLTYNLNGTDLVPALCQAGASKSLSVYLLGAKPGVAEAAAAKLKRAYSGLIIAGTQHGYFPPEDIDRVLANIREAQPHLLLVAMGVPLQELWIRQYADRLPGITCMGVGGLFDFISERVNRAPLWMREVGFEWLWRLVVEPTRLWKRYTVGNAAFLLLVLKYVLKTKGESATSSKETLLPQTAKAYQQASSLSTKKV